MEWTTALILMMALVIPLTLTGIPIAIVVFMVGIILLSVTAGPYGTMYSVAQELAEFWSSWTILAIPLFVLMGELLFASGSATDIFYMASVWLRRLQGGLALVSVGACAVFASMCGSSTAATSTMAIVAIPEMLKRGYSQRLATGCIAGAGALAHVIPPSILMTVYASILEISIGRALMAGVIPGILLAVFYAIIVGVWTAINPNAAPKEPPSTTKEKIHALGLAWQPIVLILAVMGTLYFGIATATEAAAMGAFAALLMLLFKRGTSWSKKSYAFVEAARVACFIMLIATSGKILAMAMTYYLVPMHMVQFLLGLKMSPVMIVVLTQVLYIFLGCFLDPIGMMIITLPVVAPVLIGLGFDPYWFGVMLMINFEVALVTPPMGPQLYVIKGVVSQVPLKHILQGALIFMIAPVVMLFVLYIFPQTALWLPSAMWK